MYVRGSSAILIIEKLFCVFYQTLQTMGVQLICYKLLSGVLFSVRGKL